MTAAAEAWRDQTIYRLREAWATSPTLAPATRLGICILFTHPQVYKWDLDNRLKLLKDAIKDAIGIDDRYVTDLYVRKERGPERVYVQVYDLGVDHERRRTTRRKRSLPLDSG